MDFSWPLFECICESTCDKEQWLLSDLIESVKYRTEYHMNVYESGEEKSGLSKKCYEALGECIKDKAEFKRKQELYLKSLHTQMLKETKGKRGFKPIRRRYNSLRQVRGVKLVDPEEEDEDEKGDVGFRFFSGFLFFYFQFCFWFFYFSI